MHNVAHSANAAKQVPATTDLDIMFQRLAATLITTNVRFLLEGKDLMNLANPRTCRYTAQDTDRLDK